MAKFKFKTGSKVGSKESTFLLNELYLRKEVTYKKMSHLFQNLTAILINVTC